MEVNISLDQNTNIDYELIRLAFDSGDMATIVDAQGRLRYIGKRYAAILGASREDLIGKCITDVIPNSGMLNVMQSGEGEYGKVFLMKNNVPIIVDRYPIRDNDGKIRGAVCVNSFSDVSSMQKLRQTIRQLEQENERYRQKLEQLTGQSYFPDTIVGTSAVMVSLKEMVKQIAPSNLTVLLTGETGCGKEVFADAIHNQSGRRKERFIKINCAAIPKELLESELFGYSAGAFSGASKGGKPGKFELANGGTLLLDEIGEMPLDMQSKLLRVLQERQVERVGGLKTIPVDIRIICSTNRDLLQMVAEGSFRQDLYYRINTVELHIPSLRERKEDIPELCQFFIQKINQTHNCRITGISQEVLQLFLHYDWPGNVRELHHVLECACVLATEGLLTQEDFSFFVRRMPEAKQLHTVSVPNKAASEIRLRDHRDQAEIDAIIQALQQTGGNKTKAAKLLGITRSMLYSKLKKYHMDP